MVVNYVYKYMPGDDVREDIPGLGLTAIWSHIEVPDVDGVVYINGYSFDKRLVRRNPAACRIVYLCEPLSVYPLHYGKKCWKNFHAVITWNEQLASAAGRMHYMPIVHYDYPFPSGHGCVPTTERPLPVPETRKHRICQIVGDKYSPIIGELYSLRREAAHWFYDHGNVKMDVYGYPAMNVPDHCGFVNSKLDTFSQYRFGLCFENLYHPIWSRGYLTEKIFDCMAADCVPVYYGCYNVEDHIPSECYIDFRKYGSFKNLDRFLSGLTDRDYLEYVQNIRQFFNYYNPTSRHSCMRLYELSKELLEAPFDDAKGQWPEDFLDVANIKESIAYALMVCGLKIPRMTNTAFKVLRRLVG